MMMHNLAMTHLCRYTIHVPVGAGNALYSAVAGAGAVVRLFAVSTVYPAAIMAGQVKMKLTFDAAVQRAQRAAMKASGLVHSSPMFESIRAQSSKQVVWCIPAQCVSQLQHSQPLRAQSTTQSTVNQ